MIGTKIQKSADVRFEALHYQQELGKVRLKFFVGSETVNVHLCIADISKSRIATAPDNAQGMSFFSIANWINLGFKEVQKQYPDVVLTSLTRAKVQTALEDRADEVKAAEEAAAVEPTE